MEQSSTIRKAMKSANLSLIIAAIAATLLLALTVVISVKPLYNHFAGPFDVTAEELISIQGSEDTFRTYIRVHPEIALDTGFYYYEGQENGTEKIMYSYYALLLKDNLLLTKYPGTNKGDILNPEPVTGRIARFSEAENTEVLKTLINDYPNLKDAFLPFLLDTMPGSGSAWSTIIGIAALAVISIWILIRLLRRSTNPAKHPIAKNLSRYGDWQQLAQEIDAQMAEPHEIYRNHFHLTRDWLIYQTKSHFDAIPFRDLIWQYMFQITYQSFGIITGKDYSLMVCDRYGKNKNFPYGKDSAALLDLLEKLREHAPWAYTGYAAETENTWNQEPEKMIAIVDARTQALEQALAENQKITGESSIS